MNEGAGYRNTLGYFVFDTNNPPVNKDEIEAHVIIFPNTSKAPDGEMQEGDTIDLNVQLTAGQTLAFFIIPNGWGGLVRITTSPALAVGARRFIASRI